MPEHGGRLLAASRQYGRPVAEWLDLSTGINPRPWPVPPLPADAWHRLPEDDDGLTAAAQAYYGCGQVLPVAGSQAAIGALPRLRPFCRVGIVGPTFAEHAHAWRRAGHDVSELVPAQVDAVLPGLEVLVVVNPDNPSGRVLPLQALNGWQRSLAARGGWLVVDEAFADAIAGPALASAAPLPGLIVLRSLGKFFGLAGLRVGFVIAEAALLGLLDESLGPWTLARASRHLATLALRDRGWQAGTLGWLRQSAQALDDRLGRLGLNPSGACPLFRYVSHPRAEALAEHLADQGILVRSFPGRHAIRLGLPPDANALARLERAISAATGA